jgi:hypothetical protein
MTLDKRHGALTASQSDFKVHTARPIVGMLLKSLKLD